MIHFNLDQNFEVEYNDVHGNWVRVAARRDMGDAKDFAKKYAEKSLGLQTSRRLRILCVGGQIYECTFKQGARVNWTRRV